MKEIFITFGLGIVFALGVALGAYISISVSQIPTKKSEETTKEMLRLLKAKVEAMSGIRDALYDVIYAINNK
jgi:hypothetical protein